MRYQVEVEQRPSITQKSVLNNAFLIALISIIVALIPSITGMSPQNMTLTFIQLASYIISIIILVQAIKKYRDEELGGYMKFINGFLYILLIYVIVSLISSIFIYIQMKFIDPGLLDAEMNKQMAELEKKGMSEEEMDFARSIFEKIRTPFVIAMIGFFSNLIAGAVLGLILGGIFQRNRPENNSNDEL